MLISDIVFRQARHSPDRLALVCDDTELTFAQLADRVGRLASYLRGVTQSGDRVALLAENCPEYVECYYGVPLAGCGLTFLNYRLADEELRHLVRTTAPTVLLVQHRYLGIAEQLQADRLAAGGDLRVVVLDGIRSTGAHVGYEDCLSRTTGTEPARPVASGDLAWLLYTSGTTGLPKGAMLTHRSIMGAVFNSALSWGHSPDGGLLFPWPLYHVAGYAVLVSHLRGDAVHVLRRFDAGRVLELIGSRRLTELTIAPTMLAMLLAHPDAADADLSSLRTVYYGSAHMPVETLLAAMDRLPTVSYRTGFGMTELSGLAVYLSDDDHRRAADGDEDLLRCVGRPMPTTEIRVVDDEGTDVRGDDVGEVVVRGDQVTEHYWTADGPVPARDAEGWFHTGDLGRWRGDVLRIVDRRKDMIITGGENVYAHDVEEVLYTHPAVAEAAVIGLPDPLWGEAVTAVVQLRPGLEADEDELVAHCRARLAGYKRPRRVVFADRLPLNPSGKILKRVLREQLSSATDPKGRP
ncbi:AMP-binding protein [Pseudonocardia sp. RS010]|uniref:AMP-binding protein n=1 Tax=Pseudonocardia sp. RS010 TaxID=3385979 RepID=UPI00399F8E6A